MERVVVEGGPVTRAALGLAALSAASRNNAAASRDNAAPRGPGAAAASPQERLILQRGRKSLPLTWSPIELRRPPPAPATPPRRSPPRPRLELRRIPLTPEKIDFSHIKTPKKFVLGSPVKSPTSPPRKRPRLSLAGPARLAGLPLAGPARLAGLPVAGPARPAGLAKAGRGAREPRLVRHSERQRGHQLRDRLTL